MLVHATNQFPFQNDDGPGILTAFSTPSHSFAKTIMQTAGELDYGTIFDEASLLYSPMAYILFIMFVVLMPILFSNLLVRVIEIAEMIAEGHCVIRIF